MLESMFVTHAGPSQEGIEPILHCNNQNPLYSKLFRNNKVMLIGCESQLESNLKF